MEHKATRYEVRDQIATVWLHRPDRMNAWTGRMHAEYRNALVKADRDENVRAIVVTGSGRAFCVGGDSAALEKHAERCKYDPGTPTKMEQPGVGVDYNFDMSFAYQFGLQKPIVAAINGPAAGIGLALACFTDLRFAVKGVKLTTAHGKLNLPAEYGLSWILPRVMGMTRANELLLSSRVFMTEEALELGLVNNILEPDELLPKTYDYLENLFINVSPTALRQTRWQIYRDQHRGVKAAIADSERLIERMMTEADYAEGVKAFLEKRSPSWTD